MAFSGNFVTQALPLPRGCLTVLGIRRMGSLSRGANPGFALRIRFVLVVSAKTVKHTPKTGSGPFLQPACYHQ